MDFLKLDRFFQLESDESESIEIIRLKYAEILIAFDFWTRSEPKGIHFRRKISAKNTARNWVEPWKSISGLVGAIFLIIIGVIAIMIKIDEVNEAYLDWKLNIRQPSG